MKDDKIKKSRFAAEAIIIAALYVIFTLVSDMFGMATSPLRFRISEALCVLTYYTGAAIPGLFIGSLLSNALLAYKSVSSVAFVDPTTLKLLISDIALGSGATLIAAIVSYMIRKTKWFVPIPNIVITMFSVPFLQIYIKKFDEISFGTYCIMTGIGELITSGLLGIALILALEDYKDKLFPRSNAITQPAEDLDTEGIKVSDSLMPILKEEAKAADQNKPEALNSSNENEKETSDQGGN